MCWSHDSHVTTHCTWSTAKVVRWLQLHATSPLCTSASFAQPVVDQAPRPPAETRSRQTQVHATAGEDGWRMQAKVCSRMLLANTRVSANNGKYLHVLTYL